MTKYLLACWTVLAVLFAATPASAKPPTPSQEYQSQINVIQKMSEWSGVEVDVVLEPCHMINGSYSPYSNTITLCTETSEAPGVGRFIAAHEMAPAILWNLNGDLSEYHADELAALFLLEHEDDETDLQAAAVWFITDASPKQPGQRHPSDVYRAVWLLKMVDGYLENGYKETLLYKGTLVRYELLLRLDILGD
jgi:hypothetical protein